MGNINFNYAATSAKKPLCSIKAMTDYLSANNFSSPSRGGEASLCEGRIELTARMNLAKLFNTKKPNSVVFTPNVTTALNIAIQGLVGKGGHVITTNMEHNAVARPLYKLQQEGKIDLTYIPCEGHEFLTAKELKRLIRPDTRFMVMTHASNVTGAILPYEEYSKVCNENGVFFVLDAAQSAGLINIDFDNSYIDVLAFTGHKSLMGPTGTGGFIIKDRAAKEIEPFLLGGTGSLSHLLTQPDFLPDKFEAGTPNMPGIIGLGSAVEFILETGVENIFRHETNLTNMFIEGISHERVKIYGPKPAVTRMPLISFNIDGFDNGLLAQQLYEEYSISVRSGLHCAPLAHKALGTFPQGLLRVSFGYFTTEDEVERGIRAIRELTKIILP